MAIEETVVTPESEETRDSPVVTEPPKKEGEAAEPVKGWAAFESWNTSTDDPDLDATLTAHIEKLTAADLDAMDPVAQLHAKALRHAYAKRFEETEKAANERAEKAEKAAQAREAAAARRAKEFEQKERALLAAAAAAKDPGSEPEVDVFTQDGAKQRADFAARKALYEAQAPIRAEVQKREIADRWNATVEKHPELKDPKTYEAFQAYLEQENEGVAEGQPPRLDFVRGADLFMNARELERLRAEREERIRTSDAARAQAARNIGGRATGSGGVDVVAKFNALAAKGDGSDWKYLETLSPAEQNRIAQQWQ